MKIEETDSNWTVTGEAKCSSCEGTGLYSGMAERDCAVICRKCKGKGSVEIKAIYGKFDGRVLKSGVGRVFEASFGYVHSPEDLITKDGTEIRFSQGGCTYGEFCNGVAPKPVKDLYCPYMYRNKGMGSEPIPACKKHCTGFGRISDCKRFPQKHLCWEEFEST